MEWLAVGFDNTGMGVDRDAISTIFFSYSNCYIRRTMRTNVLSATV